MLNRNKNSQINGGENAKFSLAPLCKKAQIGETMTWVVATLIIVFVLVSSVYFAILLGKTKSLSYSDKSSIEESFVEVEILKAYELNSENKIQIDEWINFGEKKNEEIVEE